MRKNTCSKCNNLIEGTRLNQAYCKSCHASYMRDNRPKHNELTDEEKLKSNCRSYTNTLVKRGKIIKKPCMVCGDTNVQAHHLNYNYPRIVDWLCRAHHLELHNTLTAILQ